MGSLCASIFRPEGVLCAPSSALEVGAAGGYDRFAHLTNYSICKKDEAYVRNTDAEAGA